uniref:Uncharacterized protein n=1 Tax=Arcella intermedia TaxID=1963864 RepID=A0A6B2LT62_9EUKA
MQMCFLRFMANLVILVKGNWIINGITLKVGPLISLLLSLLMLGRFKRLSCPMITVGLDLGGFVSGLLLRIQMERSGTFLLESGLLWMKEMG